MTEPKHTNPGFPVIREASDGRAIRNGVIAGLIATLILSATTYMANEAFGSNAESATTCPPVVVEQVQEAK